MVGGVSSTRVNRSELAELEKLERRLLLVLIFSMWEMEEEVEWWVLAVGSGGDLCWRWTREV